MAKSFKMLDGEFWWGITVLYACDMPFDKNTDLTVDLITRDDWRTQAAPLMLSNKGRYIWCEDEVVIAIKDGVITYESDDVFFYDGGKTLRDAYIAAQKNHFPNEADRSLPEVFFKKAQYNTWIELMYDQNQKDVLEYSESIVKNGYEPGILMIDEGWQKNYGLWEFDPVKFPDPKSMIERLHKMGFKVMLWVVPTVVPDSGVFRTLWQDEDVLLRDPETKKPIIVEWWNGFSAIFNFTQEKDRSVFTGQLDKLVEEYGVDGFKFDGGSHAMYKAAINGEKYLEKYSAPELNNAYLELGAKYEFHEFKDTWKFGGRHTIQRLFDKNPTWDETGIKSLIPHSAFVGLLGHPFICPDMIGGGSFDKFLGDFKADQELFVRMAQCSALCPMMQYSISPWKVLDADHQLIAKEAAEIHSNFANVISEEVKKAEESGEPILRLMEYNYPGCGYEKIKDQFMLGERFIVAPVVQQAAVTKDVVLPEGLWKDLSGNEYEGGQTVTVDAPVSVLPVFEKID